MTKWFLLVLGLDPPTIVDRSLAAEISKDQLATAWGWGSLTCNRGLIDHCAATEDSPRLRSGLMERSGNCDPYLDYKCLEMLSRRRFRHAPLPLLRA